jgi:Rieske Fe-S protein
MSVARPPAEVNRRAFLGCGALTALAVLRGSEPTALGAAPGPVSQPGPRTELLFEGRSPLRASQLAPHTDYVFAYPHAGTPCFLLDLGRPLPAVRVELRGGGDYAWPGGVGPGGGVVAYSAICPHTYTHPTREGAMIHYFAPDQPATVARRGGVVTCCVHGSAFDPARGAVPLQPPAEVPLAAVRLEWDPATDGLHAVGLAGLPVFAEFFASFPRSSRAEVGATTAVWPLARYSAAVFPC